MNKTLLIARNDFEGIASSILLNVLFEKRIDIMLYKYEQIDFDIDYNYEQVIVVGLKYYNIIDKQLSKDIKFVCYDNYNSLYEYCLKHKNDYFLRYNNLNILCEHISSYLNWTWKEKELYYAKNIDELSKFNNKNEVINVITDRILKDEKLVTDLDKELIILSKKMITNYTKKKKYYLKEHNGIKFAYAFCEINEIELANKLIESHNVDVVILANLNTGLIRIKTKEKNMFKDKILNMNGHVNSNGGTIKIDDNIVKKINDMLFNNIIATLNKEAN